MSNFAPNKCEQVLWFNYFYFKLFPRLRDLFIIEVKGPLFKNSYLNKITSFCCGTNHCQVVSLTY